MPVKNCEEIIQKSLERKELKKYIEIKDDSYRLNLIFWDEFEKRTSCIDLVCDVILVHETDEDRKKLDEAGIAHCPSCGSPMNKSDIFQLSNGLSCCLTEYVNAAFKQEKCRKMRDGSISVKVKRLPDICVTGSTRGQYRENLIQAIRDWITTQQREGKPIPDIRDEN
jgi:predicted RNase H-like HicB family nuclease